MMEIAGQSGSGVLTRMTPGVVLLSSWHSGNGVPSGCGAGAPPRSGRLRPRLGDDIDAFTDICIIAGMNAELIARFRDVSADGTGSEMDWQGALRSAARGAFAAARYQGERQRDEQAVKTLQRVFPDRRVAAFDASTINAGGGGIHCNTQQVPKVRTADRESGIGVKEK
jgi:hypothetical protein